MTDRISPRQFEEAEGIEDWRVLGEVPASTSLPSRSRQAHEADVATTAGRH
jgi:hypothetical protein